VVTSGVARIWYDDRGAEGASIDAPKAPSGVGYGEGCPLGTPLQPTRGSGVWGSVVSSPAWSGAEPWPLSHFLHVLGHRTLLVARKYNSLAQTPKYKENFVFFI